MRVLKGFGLVILSFLLFLSLSVFGIAFMINSTLLNPDFVAAEVDKIDVSALVIELTEEQIGEQLPEEVLFLKEAFYKVISDQEPWLKEQVNTAIYSGYDYFLGKSDSLNILISLEPLKISLRDSLWQTFNEDLPLELFGLSEDQVKPYFDDYYQEIAKQIPSELAVDESIIPPEAMEQIRQVKRGIGYFQTGYGALIGFMVLLVAGIILINRNVRDTTRGLGIIFLIYGIIEFAGVYFARNFAPTSLPLHDVPPMLQPWLMGLYSDLLAPLQMFSLGVLIGGVVLLVVSFVYKPREEED
jgi:hypothetical protein